MRITESNVPSPVVARFHRSHRSVSCGPTIHHPLIFVGSLIEVKEHTEICIPLDHWRKRQVENSLTHSDHIARSHHIGFASRIIRPVITQAITARKGPKVVVGVAPDCRERTTYRY